MFVDDAYLFHATTKLNETAFQLQQIVQRDLNEWDQGLESSGVKLNGSKTNYVIMKWEFASDGTPFLASDTTLNSDVYLTNNNTKELMQKISLNKHPKHYKSLGVHTPPTLQDEFELDYIANKFRTFTKF